MNLNKKEKEDLAKVQKGDEKYEFKVLSENKDNFSFIKLDNEEVQLR